MNKEKLTLIKMLKQFEIYLYARENSQATMKAYITDISQFIEFLKNNYPSKVYIEDIDLRILESYKIYLVNKVSKQQICAKTKDRKLDSVIVLYKFLESHFKIENLAQKLVINRTKKNGYSNINGEIQNKIKYLSQQECTLLLEKIIESNHIDKLRDYCIVLLMLTTGIRGSSVREARFEDFDFIEKTMVVRNVKGSKAYSIPITPELCNALSSYHTSCPHTADKIFLSNKGDPLSKSAFNNMIKRVLKYINIDQNKVSSHIFRHTFVMDMLSRKNEPEKIIKFTGHSSINELAPYIHFQIDDLRDCLKFVA
ncbi:tyrosine-type recombinase/integrase [Anaerotignum propionicum]|uniref:Site-specific recombinase XerD n=1 Tax=Anaerotignum propionicum DSM 1682 TaxID=991789 RepID=A0A0X8VBF5_ANAPI|nr:tyrosine-type recombinase/integrase [Anaerotignum propionicum]AMJ39767.1 tyrosine recombinase XerC [Anaerotignum propionicum DSM 1682]SHE28830.1 Site-specific recombinase XerD [[Clostridium] propionicum DSM 1682] [Anaerotignum propionicum DSM 1682]